MKKFTLLTAIATLALLGLSSSNVQASFSSTNALIVQLKITGLMETADSPVISTNSNGTVTTGKYNTTSVKVTSQDVLNILHTEFGGPAFPDGSQLVYNINTGRFAVADSTGSIILDVETNLTDSDYIFQLSDTNVVNSAYIQTINGKEVFTTEPSKTNTVLSATIYAPDYGIFYADGNGNDFHFLGLVTEKINIFEDLTISEYKAASIIVTGSGGGDFYNSADDSLDSGVFTKAQATIKGKNITGGF
jgi:hypothetical protein